MNPNRMTMEELKSLNPSMENPIELVCDDGVYISLYSNVKVIGIYKDRAIIIDENDTINWLGEKHLKHYPSLKNEPRKPRSFGVLHVCKETFERRLFLPNEAKTTNWMPITITERGEVVEVVE